MNENESEENEYLFLELFNCLCIGKVIFEDIFIFLKRLLNFYLDVCIYNMLYIYLIFLEVREFNEDI